VPIGAPLYSLAGTSCTDGGASGVISIVNACAFGPNLLTSASCKTAIQCCLLFVPSPAWDSASPEIMWRSVIPRSPAGRSRKILREANAPRIIALPSRFLPSFLSFFLLFLLFLLFLFFFSRAKRALRFARVKGGGGRRLLTPHFGIVRRQRESRDLFNANLNLFSAVFSRARARFSSVILVALVDF